LIVVQTLRQGKGAEKPHRLPAPPRRQRRQIDDAWPGQRWPRRLGRPLALAVGALALGWCLGCAGGWPATAGGWRWRGGCGGGCSGCGG